MALARTVADLDTEVGILRLVAEAGRLTEIRWRRAGERSAGPPTGGLLRSVAAAVNAALRGREPRLELDLAGLPPFHQRVLRALREVPRGSVIRYAELAARVGSPRAARAVGDAMRRNPFPILIPCHRVVARGGLGGFGGGLEIKRRLLRSEGVDLDFIGGRAVADLRPEERDEHVTASQRHRNRRHVARKRSPRR
ncbi:MAG: methylated-DNA--[protein]-cysteine S-methyltransferase [Planctomycetes bacterium]|nr:methylated-DNA--[protein]-cysteine S-methyltransferase [Planctomycetota bacterium]